jgi:hypothetical protein
MVLMAHAHFSTINHDRRGGMLVVRCFRVSSSAFDESVYDYHEDCE